MPERHFVANSMTQAIAKVSMDRGIFKISMETAVAASVTAELATWGTLWLMSCRVLKRGMEDAMMATVVAEAAARGVKTIVGHYYPTAKNAMVREFYAQYDFAKTAEDADGNTEWTLDVAAYTPKHPHMKIER